MRIKSAHFRHFRRFVDLRITGIPEDAKLVMMLGPNGTGKSSVFDGFLQQRTMLGGWGLDFNTPFFRRPAVIAADQALPETTVEFHSVPSSDHLVRRKLFYIRTAQRHEADFSQATNQRVERPRDEVRFHRTIDTDTAVGKNYSRYVFRTVDEVHDFEAKIDRNQSVASYSRQLIEKINGPLNRVLPALQFQSFGRPGSGDATFYFMKNGRTRFPYVSLSGGERAAFDIILDMVVKAEEFDDTVYCIDEPEAHLNPSTHGQCLEEILALTPDTCQLWLATHSIGMIRRARDIARHNPGAVAFLDFDVDFDQPVVLRPASLGRELWSRSLRVALDDLAALVAPSQIIICEGRGANAVPGELREDALDAEIYNRVFSQEFPETRFYSAGSHADTERAKEALLAISRSALPALSVKRLIDRDDRSDQGLMEERSRGSLVLSERNLECYLFSDEILTRLCTKHAAAPESIERLLETKRDLLEASTGSNGDLKAIAGRLYVECKRQLGLQFAGQNAKEFMRDTLASLLEADTETYKKLRKDIFVTVA